MSQAIVQRRLQIVIDESGADAALKRLTASADKLEKEIANGTKAGKDMTEQMAQLATTKSRMEELSNVLSGKFAPSFKQAQSAVSNLKRELDRMSADNPKYAATFDRYKQASAVFDQMKTKVSGFRQAAQSTFSQIKSVALGVTVGNTITAITQSITGLVTGAIQGAAKLSDEIADIQKVTGLAKNEVEALNKEMSKINTRTSASELRQIAFAAGKLGIEGKENILEFVRAADQINVALGEDLGEGAIREIGKLVDIFKVSDEFGIEKGLLKVGSVINEIGASSSASEGFLVDFSKRVAGIAPAANISIQEVIALAGTLDSLGQTAEVSSTAIGNTLSKLATDFEGFGQIAGISGDALKKTFLEQGGLEALKQVLAGVNQSADGFDQLIAKLGDVGIEGSRAKSVFAVLANNLGELDRQTKIANDAFSEGISITNEFSIKNETLGAQLDKLGKRFAAALNSSTIREATSSFLGFLNELTEGGDSANNEFNRTTEEFKRVEGEINKLIPRYDELAGRTNLNATEQTELRNIINRIIEIVPGAASAFDEYGNALDINKDKIQGYVESNKQLLRELEADAVESLTDRIEYILEFIPKAQAEMNAALRAGDEKRATQWLQTMRKVQVEAVDNADVLKQKYGIELPTEINNGVTAIARALGRITELPGAIDRAATGVVELLLPPDTVVGNQSSTTTPTASAGKRPGRTGKSAAQIEAERRKKELEELAKELQRIEQELFLNTLDPYQKRLAQIAARYEQLFTKAGTDIKLRDKALRLMLEEARQLNAEFEKEALKAFDEAARAAVQDEERLKALAKQNEYDRIEEELEKGRRDRFAAAEVRFLEAMSRLRIDNNKKNREDALEAEIALILAKRNAELNEGNKTANERKAIELKADEEVRQARQRNQELMLQDVEEFMNKFLSVYTTVSDIISGFEGAQVRRLEGRFDREMDMLDKQLKQKLITEQDYYLKSQNLQTKFDRERTKIARREHKRNQIASITQVLVDSATGAIRLWKEPGFPANIPLLALLALQTAGSIAKISATRPPEFAKGGMLPQGSSHAQGGIGLYDNRTGRHLGEIEGGEPIISRKVYKANKSIIDALLQKGWAQDTTPLPRWHTAPVQGINVSKLNRRYFADGGFAPQAVEDPAANAQGSSSQSDNEMKLILAALVNRLNEPIYANVIYGEYETKADAINGIRVGGTIN